MYFFTRVPVELLARGLFVGLDARLPRWKYLLGHPMQLVASNRLELVARASGRIEC